MFLLHIYDPSDCWAKECKGKNTPFKAEEGLKMKNLEWISVSDDTELSVLEKKNFPTVLISFTQTSVSNMQLCKGKKKNKDYFYRDRKWENEFSY